MGRNRRVEVPSWINEGMGDYLFGGTWRKKDGKASFSIETNWWRLETIQTAVKENKHVPFTRLFRFKQSDYYADAGLCYAEVWVICYFFLTSEVAKKKGYNKLVQKLLGEPRNSENFERSTDITFRGLDLRKMEEEWKEFVLGLKATNGK